MTNSNQLHQSVSDLFTVLNTAQFLEIKAILTDSYIKQGASNDISTNTMTNELFAINLFASKLAKLESVFVNSKSTK